MRRTMTMLLIAAAVGCTSPHADPWNGTTKLKVATTFAPIQCFALNVAGDDAEVRRLLGSQGPHGGEIPTGQAAMLAKADVLFANGLKVDDTLVRKMTATLKDGPIIVKLGNEIPKEQLIEGVCPCCHDEEDAGHKHEGHKEYDGHVWLGIAEAKLMATQMGKVIGERQKTPAAAATGAAFAAKLDKLQADGKAMLQNKKERMILPFHGSLAYFARSFDLKLATPIQEVPGQEPSAKHLKDVIEQCVREKVRVIAVEPQYGAGTSAKAVFDELKKRGLDPVIVVIDPLETAVDSEFGPDWYETKMRQNLTALAGALK